MYKKKPDWLKVKIDLGANLKQVKALTQSLSLNTVCQEANCPNRMECYNKRTATFMILGSVCTRNCRFCNVTPGKPQCVDPEEPRHLAEAVKELGLKHAVVTSVTRDDLPDGGASHFAKVIEEIRRLNPNTTVEVLIPDLKGNWDALKIIVDAKPEILNHNVETTPNLYKTVRPQAIYKRSLELLEKAKEMDNSILTKSGFMLGLGETEEEIIDLLKDLRAIDCDVVTIGQYLRPSKEHLEVKEYVHPDTFNKYRDIGMEMGFKYIASSPLVRSSYNASKVLEQEGMLK
ncbi:lipoyl synthase [Hathewaya massiliensis]|uniref:lipoyl synthase n=1 Tax=Hathewaya massiliensis TaxID=1964382 RepID=UPI00115723DE|nr:lipoyl synthase [Hathewaya massiliensis]